MSNVQLTHSKHVFPFAAFLSQNGEPVGRLLHQAGLPSTSLDDLKVPVPTSAIWRFRELAARCTGLPNITLSVMASYEIADLGAVGQSVLRQPTLIRMIQEFQRLVATESSTAAVSIKPREGGVLFSVHFAFSHQQGEWHAELYLLTWMLKIVRLVDRTWCPMEICCVSKSDPGRVNAIAALTSRPRFGQCYTGFPIPASMLALSYSGSKPQNDVDIGEGSLWSTAPSNSFAGATKQMVKAYAADGWLTVNQASDASGVSLRTLQRRLSAEGTTYLDVLEEARAEMARDLLADTDAPLCEIATKLGYSNQSNFTRAFLRWASVLPSEFRAQRRGSR
jgi:AraC-like DNA-binding protein